MISEQLTTWLLWTLLVLGAWNGINMIARLYYGQPWGLYSWSVLLGAWAGAILWFR